MRDLRKANEMLERITESVCRMLGDVKPSEVAGRSRTERVATARHIVAWAMVRIHKFSLTDTGMAMNRNHGTIINSIKIVESWSNWPLQNAKLLTITKKLKETMKREDEIKANAEAYGLGEYTKAGFIAGAEWADAHPTNLWKDAQSDDLPVYDREVVVLIQDYPDDEEHLRVACGHRPNPNGYITKDDERLYPMTYGKGGWNSKNVKYWLDVELPIKGD